jgi:hypothetical protein
VTRGLGARADGGALAESDDVSGWWLFNEAIKQATLQSACMDLGLGRQGSKPHMRRRILASVGTPLDDIEEGQDEEAGDDSEADERAAPAVAACAAEAAPVKKGRGRPRKRDAAEEVSNGRSVCGDCQHAQSPTSARGRTTAGAEANPWDAVECQRCGSTDREHKMILCDECDGALFAVSLLHTCFRAPRGAARLRRRSGHEQPCSAHLQSDVCQSDVCLPPCVHAARRFGPLAAAATPLSLLDIQGGTTTTLAHIRDCTQYPVVTSLNLKPLTLSSKP